jgi:hypothetical protein
MYAVKLTPDRVKTIADIRKQQLPVVLEQAHKHVREYFIGPITDKHLAGVQTMMRCNDLTQSRRRDRDSAGDPSPLSPLSASRTRGDGG